MHVKCVWFFASNKELYDEVNFYISICVVFYFMVLLKECGLSWTSICSICSFQMHSLWCAFPIVMLIYYVHKFVCDTCSCSTYSAAHGVLLLSWWLSSGMLHIVVLWQLTNMSEVLSASIIRAMMESVITSETLISSCETTRHDIPADSCLRTCSHDNLKSYSYILLTEHILTDLIILLHWFHFT
jgi:hypothetical protein